MNSILDRASVAEIGDPYFAASLPNALDAAFALLKPSWVPGKVNIDQCAETLEVEALRSRIRAEQELEIPGPNTVLQNDPVATLEFTFTPEAGTLATSVETDVHACKLRTLGRLIADPTNSVVIL